MTFNLVRGLEVLAVNKVNIHFIRIQLELERIIQLNNLSLHKQKIASNNKVKGKDDSTIPS